MYSRVASEQYPLFAMTSCGVSPACASTVSIIGASEPGEILARTRFSRKSLQQSGCKPHRLATDRLGSYRVAHRMVMPSVPHDTTRYANNRAEVSHQLSRRRKHHMRQFTSAAHAQRCLSVHGVVDNLFTRERHLLRAPHQRLLRARAFATWNAVPAA